jgi:ABC-2 type transport system permease protein
VSAPAPAPRGDLSAGTAVAVVARREIAVKLRDKAFIGSTLLLLLLVTAATVLPVLLSQQVPSFRVAVQGEAAERVVDLAATLGEQAVDGEPVPPVVALLQPAGLPAAQIRTVNLEPDSDVVRMVEAEDVDLAVIGEDLDALRLLGGEAVAPELEILLSVAAGRLHVAEAAAEAGLTDEQVAALTSPVVLDVDLLDPRRRPRRSARRP